MRAALAFAAWGLALAACGSEAGTAAATAPAAAEESEAYPELSGRVVDEAGLLSDAQEAMLSQRLEALESRTSDQLLVATVRSLGGRTIEDYALGLGNHWRVGQADKDNGVLLLVAPSERRVRIEVGYGLEPILTDERAAQILQRDVLPPFREQDYARGIDAGSAAIAALLTDNEAVPRRGRVQ